MTIDTTQIQKLCFRNLEQRLTESALQKGDFIKKKKEEKREQQNKIKNAERVDCEQVVRDFIFYSTVLKKLALVLKHGDSNPQCFLHTLEYGSSVDRGWEEQAV